MTAALIQFFLAAFSIIVAGTILTRAADAIAEHTKLGRLLVGSILLASATSLPELIVDIHAVRTGMPDLAVGDLAGSCLFNLLILATADLLHRSRGQMFSRVAAAHALSGATCIALMGIATVSLLISARYPHLLLGGVGPGSLVVGVTYLLTVRLVYMDQRISANKIAGTGITPPASEGIMSLKKGIMAFVLAAGAIVIAGPHMAESAGTLAKLTGLGNTFMGSTLVAFCTSLPELVATFTALRMGAMDLAIGNIYGSNAFNVAMLLPLDFFAPGSLLASVSQTHAVTFLCGMIITVIAVIGQLYQVERRTKILEPDALLVIFMVLGSLGLIYVLR